MLKFTSGGARSHAIVLAIMTTIASPAVAEEQVPPARAPQTKATMFEAEAVSDDELAATTGRENSSWMGASANNSAVVSDNKVGDNSVTGSVNVTDSAFQNVSGISMVNFNTGNNSSINAAMSVNLQINYAPLTTP